MWRSAVWMVAGLWALGCLGCAGVQGKRLVPVMGYMDSQDSTAVSPSPPPAALAVPPDTAAGKTGLSQTLLFLPFRDLTKFEGAWELSTQMPLGLSDSLRSRSFFRVIPLDSVLVRLQGKERQGRIDQAKALEWGRQLGADWVILGEIQELGMKRFRATVPIGGYRSYQGIALVVLRRFKVIDGRPAGEVKGEGIEDSQRYGVTNPAASAPLEREYFFLGETPWGSEGFHQSLVGRAVGQCLRQLAEGLTGVIRPPQLNVSEPKIIDLDSLRAYINVGIGDGVENGDKFGVWDRGRELRDPQTNVVLGHSLPERVGVVQIEQVLNEHLSVVRILEGGKQIRVEYGIRPE